MPTILPLSMVKIFFSGRVFTISESVAVPNSGLSTNIPVTNADKAKTFFVLNLAAISKICSARRYSDSGLIGCESPVNKAHHY